MLSVSEWNHQFERQAYWTRNWRLCLYRQAGLWQAQNILDVGCGTGIITAEITQHTNGKVVGLDIDTAMVEEAAKKCGSVEWKVGDAHDLPFAEGQFDLVVCNFLLLWAQKPTKVVQEMARVVKKGGVVLDTAEPDYGGRIDYPEGLPLGKLMSQALLQSGADPYIGRKLRKLFVEASLTAEDGIIASIWDQEQMAREFDQEWSFLEKALKSLIVNKTLHHYKEIERKALQAGWRLLFMPIFHALGRK